MKKLNLVCLALIALLVGACQSETESELFGRTSEHVQTQMKALSYTAIETRGSDSFTPYWEVGEKIGLFMEANNTLEGPMGFTISRITNIVEFQETISFIDPYSMHTFYAYYPYEASQSDNPKAVTVLPIPDLQEQQGNSNGHLSLYEFNVGIPTQIYPDEDLMLAFTTINSFFDFQISSNVNGLVVKQVKVEAPNGKVMNFTDATLDITLPLENPDFGKYTNMQGGTSETLLNINGGLPIPNTQNDFASAFIVFHAFDARNQKIKVTVTTEDDQAYEFEINGENYRVGNTYQIPLRIEVKKPEPVIKDIRVLSLCATGSLGTKDNTKQWNCHYGAIDLSAKEIRRLLFEHFGKGKTVETGIISFEKIDINCHLNKVTEAYLDQFDIIYLNRNASPNIQTSQRIMNWLNKSPHRVLMLAYDWKDPCITPDMKESSIICKTATNYLIFRDQINSITPHWYNAAKVNQPIGNWGTARSGLLVPFELNEQTSYFWKDGPFKTDLTSSSDQRFWIKDKYFGSAVVNDPNVIPLITYTDAKDDCSTSKQHKYGPGDGGMILGVDPVARIVYIGDSELFSVSCVNSKVENARMAKEGSCKKPGELNNYSKIMGNLWAWMIQEVIQKN